MSSCSPRIYRKPLVHAEFLHVKPGKGAAFVRTKLKNYITGNLRRQDFQSRRERDPGSLGEEGLPIFSYPDGDEVTDALLS